MATRNSSVTEATAFGSRTPSVHAGEKYAEHYSGEEARASHDVETTSHGHPEKDLERNAPAAPPAGASAGQVEQGAPPAPPDGGLLAWLQVVGAFILFFNSWGVVNTFGAFQTYYETELLSNKTSSQIAWVGSLQAFLLLVVGVATGPLFDLGHFRVLVTSGSFLVVFGLMMTSICKEYWQVILAQGLVVGIGAGCLFIPSVAVVATYFTTKRVFATGIAAAGSSLGGVIYPIMFHRLVKSAGFGWATRAIAFIALAMLILPCCMMKPRLKAKSTRSLLLPRAFLDAPFTLFTLGAFFGFIGLYIPFFFVQPYAVANGVTGELPFYLVPIINAASTAGRILPGYLADKTGSGPLNLLVPCTLAASVLAFAWVGIKNSAGIVVFSALYGFFSGTFVSLPPSVIASLTVDMSEIGTRMGMSFFFAGLGVLIGTPVSGVLIKGDNYLGTQLFCACLVVASALTMAACRFAKTGPVLLVRA